MNLKRRIRVWRYLRHRTKPVKPRKPRRHSFVIVAKAGHITIGYWMGIYRGNGFSFTKDPKRAIAYPKRELAQMSADNSLLYKHARYEVVKIKTDLLG